MLQILFQRQLFGESAVCFRNIGLGVTVALIPFDSGSVAGADEFSGRKLLKLVLDGTKFLPVVSRAVRICVCKGVMVFSCSIDGVC